MRFQRAMYVILILGSMLYTYYRHIDYINNHNAQAELTLSLYSERVKSAIENSYDYAIFIGNLIEINNGNMSPEEFRVLASVMYDNSTQRAIAYIPDGIVTVTYPLEGNEASIGHNVLTDDKTKQDSINSKNTGKIAISGPYELVQGGVGLIVRNPVYIEKSGEKTFWGFTAVVLHMGHVLNKNAQLSDLSLLGYDYYISTSHNGEDVVLSTTAGFDGKYVQTTTFATENKEWEFSLYLSDFENLLTYFTLSVFTISFLISTLIYFLLVHLNIRHKRIKDELLHDPLTKLYNRKVLKNYKGNKKMPYDEGYTLFFIDLNKFKPVNDELGHDIGDDLLVAYSKRLISNFRQDTVIIRYGGDEFVVIIHDLLDENRVDSIKRTVKGFSESLFYIQKHPINISASIGVAQYPKDGASIEEVIEKADKLMYEHKMSTR